MQVLKVIVLMIFSSAGFLSFHAYSAESNGKIEAIRVCSAETAVSPRWNNFLLFKMDDGTWYSVYGNYLHPSGVDYDDNLYHSSVLLAYSGQYNVRVSTNTAVTRCGISTYQIWSGANEFIELYSSE